MISPILLALTSSFFLSYTLAEVIPYSNHYIFPLRPEYLTIPKYAKNDAPSWPPGHGHSYIDMSRLRIRVNCVESKTTAYESCSNSSFQILMFEEPTGKPWIEYWPDRNFCCTQDLINSGKCFEEGSLILPSTLPTAFMRKILIKANAETSLAEDVR